MIFEDKMGTLIQPFDLQYLLVSTFAGNMYIFVVLMMLAFATLAARFRMNVYTLGAVTFVFSVFMIVEAQWIYLLTVLIGGIIIYFSFAKIGK